MSNQFTHVMAVSLESAKRFKAYGVYNGSNLAITHCIPILGNPSKWRDDLISEIKEKTRKNFIILVEDRTGVFCVGDASPFSFEDIEENRSMLFHSLDWYFAMLDMGQLLPEPDVKKFIIYGGGENQKIEKLQDDKGRTIYKVNWAQVDGGTKAVLMCVAGVMMQPLSERFLDLMYGSIGDDDDTPIYKKTWDAITRGVDESKISEWDEYYRD